MNKRRITYANNSHEEALNLYFKQSCNDAPTQQMHKKEFKTFPRKKAK